MKLKSLLILLLAAFCTISTQAQNFEGVLTYTVELEVGKEMQQFGLTAETLKESLKEEGSWADTIKITYHNGNYHYQPLMANKTYTIYRADSNKIFGFTDDNEHCTVTDAGVDLEKAMGGKGPKIFKRDTTITVNGTVCKIVRVKWATGYYDYYYADNINPIDPAFYSKHINDGLASYLAFAKALPVRIVKNVAGNAFIMTLADTRLQKIPDTLFALPAMEPDDTEESSLLNTLNVKTMKIKK